MTPLSMNGRGGQEEELEMSHGVQQLPAPIKISSASVDDFVTCPDNSLTLLSSSGGGSLLDGMTTGGAGHMMTSLDVAELSAASMLMPDDHSSAICGNAGAAANVQLKLDNFAKQAA